MSSVIKVDETMRDLRNFTIGEDGKKLIVLGLRKLDRLCDLDFGQLDDLVLDPQVLRKLRMVLNLQEQLVLLR